jgi:SAM-dependent methyltransferase
VPVQGPQQRRRLLKELGKDKPRKKFSVSPREIRRSVGKMFSFRPLTPLNAAELSLLKKHTTGYVERHVGYWDKPVLDLLSGKSRLEASYGTQTGPFGKKTTKPRTSTLRKMFSDGKKFYAAVISNEKDAHGVGSGSRGLKEYLKEGGIDVLNLAKSAHRQLGRSVRILDVGSETAKMLSELKEKLGSKVELHALNPVNTPREKGVDAYHMLVAECMPIEFRRKFDLIVSHRAMEYTLFPHLALRNIVEALAPGGRADLHWRGGRTYLRGKLSRQLSTFFSNYKSSKASTGAKQIIKEGMLLDNPNVTNAQVNEKIKRGLKKYGVSARQNLAWCNEIARLRNSPNFNVKIESWTIADFGRAPRRISIERTR